MLVFYNVEGTRVILHNGEMSTSLMLSNSEKQPTLVQVWSDAGSAAPTRACYNAVDRRTAGIQYEAE
ncbi:fimbria/pilus periplasmic chaperone [Symbiopectobacterium sp. RP]|uniref:fimbria/pilus periplasmic chaperone n=1 Tax=Symbiopectobacterium sp. RP TaxID=3248553 RepID=UPI003D2A745A